MKIPTHTVTRTMTEESPAIFIKVTTKSGKELPIAISAGHRSYLFFGIRESKTCVRVIFLQHNLPSVYFLPIDSTHSKYKFDDSIGREEAEEFIEQIGQEEFETASGTAKLYYEKYEKRELSKKYL